MQRRTRIGGRERGQPTEQAPSREMGGQLTAAALACAMLLPARGRSVSPRTTSTASIGTLSASATVRAATV
jgi:hypothetical protein